MKRIDSVGATVDHHYTAGDPIGGTPATRVNADNMNIIQEEMCGLIEYAGLTLDQSHAYGGSPAHDTTQLRQAILALVSGGGGATQLIFSDSPYTGVVTKKVIPVDTSSGNFVFNLPAASTVLGQVWRVGKITSDANTITVNAAGSDTVQGASSTLIDQQWTFLGFLAVKTGSTTYAWVII